MFATRGIVLSTCGVLAAVLVTIGSAGAVRFVTPLHGAALDRVRGLDDYSDSDDINVACADQTFEPPFVYDCEGEDDGTDCGQCTGNANGRLTKLVGEGVDPIERAGGAYVCNSLTAFSGTCQNGVCVGDDDGSCLGGALVYQYEP